MKYRSCPSMSFPLKIFDGEENPFPATGDAAYRKRARGGPSHGHRQHTQKFGKDSACGSGDILADRRTRRQIYASQYFATAPAGEVTTQNDLINKVLKYEMYEAEHNKPC